MNQKAQIPIDPRIASLVGLAIFLIFIAPVLIGVLGDAFNDAFCQQEKGDITNLQNKISDLEQRNQQLEDLLSKCQLEHGKTKQECQRQINQTVAECNTELDKIGFILNHYTINFWIFSISLVFVVLFGINLFEIKISFGKRFDKFINQYSDFWKFVQWIIFVIFVLAVIITFLNLAFKLGILLGYF